MFVYFALDTFHKFSGSFIPNHNQYKFSLLIVELTHQICLWLFKLGLTWVVMVEFEWLELSRKIWAATKLLQNLNRGRFHKLVCALSHSKPKIFMPLTSFSKVGYRCRAQMDRAMICTMSPTFMKSTQWMEKVAKKFLGGGMGEGLNFHFID